MAHQVALTDEDYAALHAAADERGESIETLLHKAIVNQFPMPAAIRPQQGIYTYPTEKPIGPALKAEMEQLAAQLGGAAWRRSLAAQLGDEHPWLSEMVIEDRGPR